MSGFPVYKCDKLSMEILAEYPSAAAAARDNGLDPTSLSQSVRAKRVSYGPYVYRHVKDYDPNETFEGKANRPVVCYDTETKRAVVFTGTDKAAAYLGVSSGSITGSMCHKARLFGRYVFKFAI